MNIIFATKSVFGFDTMKKVALDICGNLDYEFYSTGPQISLFENKEYQLGEINKKIGEYIYKKYNNTKVSIRILNNDLMNHNKYPSYFLKSGLKYLEKIGKINKVIKMDGSKRRAGTFPDNSIVYFNSEI